MNVQKLLLVSLLFSALAIIDTQAAGKKAEAQKTVKKAKVIAKKATPVVLPSAQAAKYPEASATQSPEAAIIAPVKELADKIRRKEQELVALTREIGRLKVHKVKLEAEVASALLNSRQRNIEQDEQKNMNPKTAQAA